MKSHINIGTLGHIDHGKTTLTSAISKVLGLKYNTGTGTEFTSIDSLPEEKLRGITIRSSHVGYETEKRSYNHLDIPGHSDFVKNAILGLNQMDYGILLVDGREGVMTQTREHVLLGKQTGLSKLAVFVNKCDIVDDKELLEIVEMDIIELLERIGYKKNDYFIVMGSALQALENPTNYDLEYGAKVILEMFNKIETLFPLPTRNEDKTFIMSIEEVFIIKGRGTVITGTPTQGQIKCGETVEIINKKKEKVIKTVITGIQQFHKNLNIGVAGTNLGLLLRGVEKTTVGRGDIVTIPGSYKRIRRAKALFYLFSTNEGGRKNPIFSGYTPLLFVRNDDVKVKIYLEPGNDMILPGEYFEGEVVFDYPMILEKDTTFSMRDGHTTVGSGKIIEIIE